MNPRVRISESEEPSRLRSLRSSNRRRKTDDPELLEEPEELDESSESDEPEEEPESLDEPDSESESEDSEALEEPDEEPRSQRSEPDELEEPESDELEEPESESEESDSLEDELEEPDELELSLCPSLQLSDSLTSLGMSSAIICVATAVGLAVISPLLSFENSQPVMSEMVPIFFCPQKK